MLRFGHRISGCSKWARRRPFLLKGTISLPHARTGDAYGKERQLFSEIAPRVAHTVPGTEVLAVELLSPSRFCVYLDRSEGVDFALCERVTRLLEDYRSDWTIDVSSPGPERPLRTEAHFRRAMGSVVQVKTATEVGGKRKLRGTVVEIEDAAVVLDEGGETVRVPVDAIVRANLIDEGR